MRTGHTTGYAKPRAHARSYISQKVATSVSSWFLAVICRLVAVLCLLAGTATAATINQPETWSTNGVAGWRAVDALNGGAKFLSNPGDRLKLAFPAQTMSLPELYLMSADADGSGGRFVGDYAAAGVKSIRFKVYCGSHIPRQARLQFFNSETGNMWWYELGGLKVGEWVSFSVPMVYGDWWRLGMNPTAEKFNADMSSVDWIGIRIMRNGAIAGQDYEIDDFMLSDNSAISPVPSSWVAENFGAGTQNTVDLASADSDGDGFSNYAEYLTGTDPNDEDSLFELEMENEEGPQETDVVLKWKSVTNRWYTVGRAADLMTGFTELEINVPGTPPVNVYKDSSATNKGPYFYRIRVRE